MYTVKKDHIKTVPYTNNTELHIQVAYLEDQKKESIFRYTRPVNMVKLMYIVTIHYVKDEQHTPYVFHLKHNETDQKSTQPFLVTAANQCSKDIMDLENTPKYNELQSALDCIIFKDLLQ